MNGPRLPGFPAAIPASLAAILFATPARADADGAYGRLDGDLGVSLGAGAAFSQGGPMAAAIARLMYLDTAGAYAHYTDACGAERPVLRSASLGIALRPLFLPRWGFDLEQGPATLDLAIDAITLDVGALFVSHQTGPATSTPGLEVALGTEVPLLGQAAGPWLGFRSALQWHPDALAAPGDTTFQSTRVIASLTLAWHAIVTAHIVDARDGILR